MATVSISRQPRPGGQRLGLLGQDARPVRPRLRHERPEEPSLRWSAQVKGDPWCLGYFVDNELSWGGFGDEGGPLRPGPGRASNLAAASSPAKRAFLERLKTKHGDIARLNAAWKVDADRLAGTRGPVEAGRGSIGLDRGIQGRPGRVREGAGADLLQDGARPAQGRRPRPSVPRLPVCLAHRRGHRRGRRVLRRGQLQHLRPPGRPREVGLPGDAWPAGDHRRVPRRGPRPRHVPHRAWSRPPTRRNEPPSTPTTSPACWTTPPSWAATGSSTSTSR